jgi:hypothetical protein
MKWSEHIDKFARVVGTIKFGLLVIMKTTYIRLNVTIYNGIISFIVAKSMKVKQLICGGLRIGLSIWKNNFLSIY